MRNQGFNDNLVHLISECISNASFSILLNGSSRRNFKPTRGIKQGDPISLGLFTIFFDLLSRILTKAEEDGLIHGVKISRHSIYFSHLMFTDDLTVFPILHQKRWTSSQTVYNSSINGLGNKLTPINRASILTKDHQKTSRNLCAPLCT